jgi:hypothetical protein
MYLIFFLPFMVFEMFVISLVLSDLFLIGICCHHLTGQQKLDAMVTLTHKTYKSIDVYSEEKSRRQRYR